MQWETSSLHSVVTLDIKIVKMKKKKKGYNEVWFASYSAFKCCHAAFAYHIIT